MRDELKPIWDSIARAALPLDLTDLIDPLWDNRTKHFHVQETYVLDYKENVPASFSEDYGRGIARLAIAYFNTYGGLIIFGIKDETKTACGIFEELDSEKLNHLIGEVLELPIECVWRSSILTLGDKNYRLGFLLVMKRALVPPAQLIKDFGKYSKGTIWLRDRHQVQEARIQNLPLLFSSRSALPSQEQDSPITSVHKSLPPSPATLKTFVNRGKLLENLWRWYVFGDEPRLYLHGPGGSGKSTLAFEFARQLATFGDTVLTPDGERVDFVIFLSAKETEFNPYTGQSQNFIMREFSNVREQYAEIVRHSGITSVSAAAPDIEESIKSLKELFSSFSGLIVIDDIDALSRIGEDTGEERLLIQCIRSNKHIRVLYTLRFPPSYALNSATRVEGLNSEELVTFLEVCAEQFEVPMPDEKQIKQISAETDNLPLLLETVLLLRRNSDNYAHAISFFKDKGGEEARRYLYQREYDRLSPQGKSRQVLAGLLLLEEPISFSAFASLFQFPNEQVRDALTECRSIFLSSFSDELGDTLYQISPPAISFVSLVSNQLSYYSTLSTKVKHFKAQGNSATPKEAALLTTLGSHIRSKQFQKVIELCAGVKDRMLLLNPRAQAYLGQAYAESGPEFMENAREAFKTASGMGYVDHFMLRSWYNMEMHCGYAVGDAEAICQIAIESKLINPAQKVEFYCKFGYCAVYRANSVRSASREKSIINYRQAIIYYMEALWLSEETQWGDEGSITEWLDRPLHCYMDSIGQDIDQYFVLLEGIIERSHDASSQGINLLLHYLIKTPLPSDAGMRRKTASLCSRTLNRINKLKGINRMPVLKELAETLKDFERTLIAHN